jgi:uncharacterized membrane protein YkoI
MIILFCSILLVLSAFSASLFLQRHDTLSQKEIKTIAARQLGGQVRSANLKSDTNYELTLEKNNGQYRVLMDAKSGEIIKLSVIKAPPASNKYSLSEDEAKSLAMKQISGTVQSVKKTMQDGKSAYSIAIQTDRGVARVVIDAITGSVVTTHEPRTDDLKTAISEQEARSIALKKVDGEMIESELEENEDQYEYKVTIKTKTDTAEVYVNAYSGKATVSWDSEDEEDEDDPDEGD